MCGVAGVCARDAIEHSGVDGVRRMPGSLAIADLDGSHQPISVPGADVHLVLNGEIYDHRTPDGMCAFALWNGARRSHFLQLNR